MQIIIEIPDNLTPAQEAIAIAKKLSQKNIGASISSKMIGAGYTIKETQTKITINRISTQKPIKTKSCSVCECVFEIKMGVKIKTNYGGMPRKLVYCSNKCADFMCDTFGLSRVNKRVSPAFLIPTIKNDN